MRQVLTGGALALFITVAALAQDSSFITLNSAPVGEVMDLATDVNGAIYAAGAKQNYGVTTPVVSVSTNGGSTWSDHFDSRVTGMFDAVATGRRQLPATLESPATFENIAVVAGKSDATGHWVVLRSINGGSWVQIDNYLDMYWPTRSAPAIEAAAIDSEGNIYITATAESPLTVTVRNKTTTEWKKVWLVRRITPNGEKSATRLPDTVGRILTSPSGVTCVGTKVYLAGTVSENWQVRRSDDKGNTWTLVDDFRFDPNYRSNAYDITVGRDNLIYVVGTASQKTGTGKWAPVTDNWWIRRGTGALNSFESIPSFMSADLAGFAEDVAMDAQGWLHVTGAKQVIINGTGSWQWITKSFNPQTQAWTISDNLPGAAHAIEADPFGNLYSAGFTLNPTVGWVIRGLEPLVPAMPGAN